MRSQPRRTNVLKSIPFKFTEVLSKSNCRMRLLKGNNTGEFSLTKDLLVSNDIPHTEEVSFKDMMDGTGKRKTGYDKIRFCGEQAGRDGLQYFWIDTCCIDKSSSSELQEAINSMFRWYRGAAKCYVYLADVSRPALGTDVKSSQLPWELSFRKSRWFTRGWTLQELVAPAIVEFFSEEGEQLGNKKSLERHIHEVTGIPVKALRGSPLSDFGIPERMLWAEKRDTTREEDKAYSLLGIFDVYMPLIYGEGRENAFKRLREEMDKASKGTKREDFSVAFSLSNMSETDQFVAREEELAEIHRTLRSDGSRHIVVLHGLGGIGKTQLTVAYAKRHKDNYSAVFWLNIKDEESLKQSFAKVAKQILREHPSASRLSSVDIKENIDEVIDAVKAWLSLPNNTRWLMIYDNYDNPKLAGNTDPAAVDIRKYLPESYQGSVIITTRSSEVKIGHRIRIGKLEDVRDSVKILSNASRREGLEDDPDAVKLAKELDGLPLALATAGAYLDQTAISFSDYLYLYKASWAKLLMTSPELNSYEDRMLYSTWQLSFNQVKQRNKLSAKLLQLWAYFDNQDLWFELLQHGGSKDPDWIRELTEDKLAFNGAVRVLSNHGLVEVDMSSQELIESRGYSIHSCVHSWTICVLNQEWDSDLARLALKFVGSHVPETESAKWWLTERRLLPHAARCSHSVLNGMVMVDGMEMALFSLGLLYANQGKLDEAEKMYQRALQGYEKAWGPDHTSTLNTVNNLGALYKSQGKLDEAEKMYQRALQGKEKAWGPDHTSTLDTVNNLGTLYADQGKLDEAEKMYQRALQGKEKAWGPGHTSTLGTVNNLGLLYADQGKLDEAEKMYQRALQGYEKAWGPGHTSTLNTVNNLGILYKSQGKLDEAEKMYERALQGKEKAWGPDHTSTLDTEKAWGPDHTSTLDTVNNLGVLYADQGKLDEAEKMYQRALQGKEKAWGPDHTSTLDTVNNLGTLYADQGKLDEAEKMYQRALQGKEKAWGPDHISTLNTVNNLGLLYADQGKLDEAEKMYQRALQGYEKAWGPGHTSTLDTVNNLGKEKAWGPDHTSTLDTVNNLGVLYADQGKLDEAEKMYQRALQGYEEALGLETVARYRPALNTMRNLGNLFATQGRLDEAKEMYSRACAGFRAVLGPSCNKCQALERSMILLSFLINRNNSIG
ncbi:TPR-like protein [Elaphomyces granulatus]